MPPRRLVRVVEYGATATALRQLFVDSDLVFVKRMSENDRDWAWRKSKHQNGPYIPKEARDSGFFPPFSVVNSRSSEVRRVEIATEWPQVVVDSVLFGRAPLTLTSNVGHYTSKVNETHLTRVAKEVFLELAPASYFVMGRVPRNAESPIYRCLTVDSTSDEADLLTEHLAIPADEPWVISAPAQVRAEVRDSLLEFIEAAVAAFRKGTIREFESSVPDLPPPPELARLAQAHFRNREGNRDFNPFAMETPGNALFQLSRVDEKAIHDEYQRRLRSVALVRLILGDYDKALTSRELIATIIGDYQKIDDEILSATQTRRARAGTSFELHIATMLADGGIPHGYQKSIGARRPDFVLPSKAFLNRAGRHRDDALILAAKTTVRERWKQVVRERSDCTLFLATVDERISNEAIREMAGFDIVLVVPERLKDAAFTVYSKHENVIDFKQFFEREVRSKRWARWGGTETKRLRRVK